MTKYYEINESNVNIRCKYFGGPRGTVKQAVITVHGFGGHKDNKSVERLAEYLLSKHKDMAVIAFDLPCHGADVRKKLTLEDCDTYLTLVAKHAREAFGAERLFAYCHSFGAYLTLKYLHEHGNPFERVVLRSPALPMYATLCNGLLTKGNLAALEKGRETAVGFDRKVPITNRFLEELQAAEVTSWEYLDFADDLLVIHGEADEIVPIAPVLQFCEDNVIEAVTVPGADHRFRNPLHMDLVLKQVEAFFQG